MCFYFLFEGIQISLSCPNESSPIVFNFISDLLDNISSYSFLIYSVFLLHILSDYNATRDVVFGSMAGGPRRLVSEGVGCIVEVTTKQEFDISVLENNRRRQFLSLHIRQIAAKSCFEFDNS